MQKRKSSIAEQTNVWILSTSGKYYIYIRNDSYMNIISYKKVPSI